MKKLQVQQPIKVIDNFFESADLWRHFALKQEYNKDIANTWPGIRTAPINELHDSLFRSVATKLVQHLHSKTGFSHLKMNFASVDKSYNLGWIHQDEPFYNIAGVIFLTPAPPNNSGLSFFTKINSDNENYAKLAIEENHEEPLDRIKFLKFKEQQRLQFKKNMQVENVFNRCVLFPPNNWHSAETYFGDTLEDSRLTITFFGIAV
jgi:tellurite resistance-related uncharacterized protein